MSDLYTSIQLYFCRDKSQFDVLEVETTYLGLVNPYFNVRVQAKCNRGGGGGRIGEGNEVSREEGEEIHLFWW